MTSINFPSAWIAVYFFIFISCTSNSYMDVPERGTINNLGFVPNPQEIEEREIISLDINEIAPDFYLPGVDGNFYSLQDFDTSKVLVIIFTCNHCPTAQAYEDRIIKLVNDYRNEDVRIIAISPNSVKAMLPEELGFSDMGDSYEEMKLRAKHKKFNFLYLYDGDSHEASIKYGPASTPHAFVFDSERKLKYRGKIDSSEKQETANAKVLRTALDAVLFDGDILVPITKTIGCAVKWGWKKSWAEKISSDWARMPVTLDGISIYGVKKLMQNGSKNLLLINIWATWCGPCVIEYPEFINMYRMYVGRDFEFVSLSIDKQDHRYKALSFLKKHNSAVKNYIYSGNDIYSLIPLIDRDWSGALPYTILVEPGGNVVYRKMGMINPQELKRIIVEHPMIGRYY